ncbi:MAG: HAD hydrolase family protein [Kiritimatiellae bacterium]|nr:HAD hydrolase family protein [Kiritimatiellia bacterium]
MPATIGLLATDLDGTLIGSANELPLYLTFHDRIEHLRAANGAQWAACTGRTFRSFWEFFMPMRRYGVVPDYVIIRHAFIYRLTVLGYVPHVSWNVGTLFRIWRETKETSAAIHAWHSTVVGGAIGVRTIARTSARLAVRFDSEEAAEVAEDMLRLRQREHKHMQIIRSKNQVEVRMVPATKGTALAELAHHLKVPTDQVLAIGNGHNDLSMLDGTVAGMVGCPNNSVFDVMTLVCDVGGHVASHPSLSGVIEIVDAFISGDVSSELPDGAAAPESRIRPAKKHDPKSGKRAGLRRSRILIITSITYAALLAFASFDAIPLSGLIRRPLELLVDAVVKLVSFL